MINVPVILLRRLNEVRSVPVSDWRPGPVAAVCSLSARSFIRSSTGVGVRLSRWTFQDLSGSIPILSPSQVR